MRSCKVLYFSTQVVDRSGKDSFFNHLLEPFFIQVNPDLTASKITIDMLVAIHASKVRDSALYQNGNPARGSRYGWILGEATSVRRVALCIHGFANYLGDNQLMAQASQKLFVFTRRLRFSDFNDLVVVFGGKTKLKANSNLQKKVLQRAF